MDLSQVDDINQLKVMAYDAIAAQEQAQRNLQIINQRIAQVSTDGTLPKVPEQLSAQEALSLDDAANGEPTPYANSAPETPEAPNA